MNFQSRIIIILKSVSQLFAHILNLELSTTVPQVVAMSDIMAGTTLEDLEYSDEEDEMESDEGDINKVGTLLG